jgi:predicted transcriptional regulator
MMFCTILGRRKCDMKKKAQTTIAWRRSEHDERTMEADISSESWSALRPVTSRRRLELLSYIRRHEVTSVLALTKALQRPYRNVYADARALEKAGLLERNGRKLRADYDKIETRIAI